MTDNEKESVRFNTLSLIKHGPSNTLLLGPWTFNGDILCAVPGKKQVLLSDTDYVKKELESERERDGQLKESDREREGTTQGRTAEGEREREREPHRDGQLKESEREREGTTQGRTAEGE